MGARSLGCCSSQAVPFSRVCTGGKCVGRAVLAGNGSPIETDLEGLAAAEELLAGSGHDEQNAAAIKSLREDTHSKELLRKCVEERAQGRMRSITRADGLAPGEILTPRFAVQQSDKIRPIDDCSR